MATKTLNILKKYKPKIGHSVIYVEDDHEYCIINQDGFLFAIDNRCPHKNESLGLGQIKGDRIICPLHQYEFNFKTGACNIKQYKVNVYDVEVTD